MKVRVTQSPAHNVELAADPDLDAVPPLSHLGGVRVWQPACLLPCPCPHALMCWCTGQPHPADWLLPSQLLCCQVGHQPVSWLMLP